MITTKHGSIFDSHAAVLVCPVNCVGVMGKGLALEFKKRWPDVYSEYREDCMGEVRPGMAWWHGEDPYIILAATKDHWRNPSRIEWVDECLSGIAYVGPRCGDSIAIPQLGCGCGGLDWSEVWPLYKKHLDGLDCDVEVWIHE